MKKNLEFRIPGIKERMTGEFDGRSNCAVVIGVDTAIGMALACSLRKAGFDIIGFGERASVPIDGLLEYRQTDYTSYGSFPEDCNLLLFCHDAAVHLNRHVSAMESLCRELASTLPPGKQVSVCAFTPANACECPKRLVTEDAALVPRSLKDLAYAQAEMTLHAWCAISKNSILPKIFRYGELYADMPEELPLAGHVNACLKKVRRQEPLVSPGLGSQKRTLTHLNDFAAMVALAVKQDFIPSVTNIPGETMEILCYMIVLENSPEREMHVDSDCHEDDLPWGVGDRALYCPQFQAGKKNAFRYRFGHNFQEWASSRPDNVPELEGFDITTA